MIISLVQPLDKYNIKKYRRLLCLSRGELNVGRYKAFQTIQETHLLHNYLLHLFWCSTAAGLQTALCQHHTICTSGSFTDRACCFKVRLKVQTLLGWFSPSCQALIALALSNCFTSFQPLEGSAELSRTLLQDYRADQGEENCSAQKIYSVDVS